MNRKKFLIISAVVGAGVAVPVIMRLKSGISFKKPLDHPWFLAHIFDKNTLISIGKAYRSTNASENTEKALTSVLLINPGGPEIKANDDSAVKKLLEKKVQTDFETKQIITVDGWILSATEARQCALFSIIEN